MNTCQKVLLEIIKYTGNQEDIYNNKEEVRVLHIHAGRWECWNEFTDSCKIGQHPQGNNQLHPTGYNSLAFLWTKNLYYYQFSTTYKIVQAKRMHWKQDIPSNLFAYCKVYHNFPDTSKLLYVSNST